MLQVKFGIKESQAEFLSNSKKYGFKDKSDMLRAAIDKLQERIDREQLIRSADLYAEIYSNDDELKEITESAIKG
jgi:hypothetical protein